MISLLVVAFAAGLATALSPCVLPILPVVAATSGAGGRRRPLGMAAGLVLTFTVFTLTAARVLDALGLPDDALRTLGIAPLALAGVALLVPAVAELAGRPFQPLARAAGRRVQGGDGFAGGVAIGAALGLVWTPCAGPVLAAVSVLAANQDVSARVVAITLAYAFGAALPLLGIALAGQRATTRIQALRAHGPALRRTAGAIMVAAAALFATDVPERLAVALPGDTSDLQAFERSNGAQDLLDDLTGAKGLPVADQSDASLRDFGMAPGVAQIAGWINTPGDRPLAADDFAGRRCSSTSGPTRASTACARCLYLTRVGRTYSDAGLVILGVHTPEFAFERDPDNVERAVHEHGLGYPVALDPEYGTWNACFNRYWPAKYLIDRQRPPALRPLRRGRLRRDRARDPARSSVSAARPPRQGKGRCRARTSRRPRRIWAPSARPATSRPCGRACASATSCRRSCARTRSASAASGRSAMSARWPGATPCWSCATAHAASSSCSRRRREAAAAWT